MLHLVTAVNYLHVFFLVHFFSSVFTRSVQCIDLRNKSNMDG